MIACRGGPVGELVRGDSALKWTRHLYLAMSTDGLEEEMQIIELYNKTRLMAAQSRIVRHYTPDDSISLSDKPDSRLRTFGMSLIGSARTCCEVP